MSYSCKGPISRVDKLICDIKGTHNWDFMSDLSGKTHACWHCGKVEMCVQEKDARSSETSSAGIYQVRYLFDCKPCEQRFNAKGR